MCLSTSTTKDTGNIKVRYITAHNTRRKSKPDHSILLNSCCLDVTLANSRDIRPLEDGVEIFCYVSSYFFLIVSVPLYSDDATLIVF